MRKAMPSGAEMIDNVKSFWFEHANGRLAGVHRWWAGVGAGAETEAEEENTTMIGSWQNLLLGLALVEMAAFACLAAGYWRWRSRAAAAAGDASRPRRSGVALVRFGAVMCCLTSVVVADFQLHTDRAVGDLGLELAQMVAGAAILVMAMGK